MTEVKRILLRMQGGFCNRLRAIVSGVLWAEDLNSYLHIYWPVEPHHMASALDELIEASSIPHLSVVYPAYLGNARQVLNSDDMEMVVANFCKDGEIRIQSYSEFHPEVRGQRGLTILRNIRFVPDLERIASTQWRIMEGASDWIGVHFRGTDHLKCLKASPLSSFFRLLGPLPPKMLLVSDEQDVKDDFVRRYGREVVGTTDLELGRRTSQQQKAGVIEWLLLQKCGQIMGSLGSSYSEMAALRAGCIYTTLTA